MSTWSRLASDSADRWSNSEGEGALYYPSLSGAAAVVVISADATHTDRGVSVLSAGVGAEKGGSFWRDLRTHTKYRVGRGAPSRRWLWPVVPGIMRAPQYTPLPCYVIPAFP